MDCSPFLNWRLNLNQSTHEKPVIFLSLVATVKSRHALDASLEAKALTFLNSVYFPDSKSIDAFLSIFARKSDESSTNLVQSFVVLFSTSNLAIIAVSMKILNDLLWYCSTNDLLAIIRADLIPQIIIPLNPLSLSFAKAEDIHRNLMKIISRSLWLSTPAYLTYLEIEDRNERQTVHETILRQVLEPTEQYICHLCANRYSIIEGRLSKEFKFLLTDILEISPYYRPTMDIVLNMPVFLTIPSCLPYFEEDDSIYDFLSAILDIQLKWNKTSEEDGHRWRSVYRMSRTEGMEDVIEAKLQNDKDKYDGGPLVANSIEWSNLHGMNLPEQE
ncbi:hypothetical protein BLNAU_12365 [Blattamonas nauphoetae]|uniref:Uncharacterized protein n=1 Tax=Blattamonas nauphoetae TaxID=2049346 RepID=A0ABQ9XJW5_9EUKA|nr:hypothetical protein BLNAU_12365 [Blattamonas nauphoetae]